MLRKLNLNYLIVLFWLQQQATVSANDSSTMLNLTESESEMQATVLNDYCNAFKMFTNKSVILNKIVPKMYKFDYAPDHMNFTFKLPIAKAHKPAYEMLILRRSDFEDPIFPNLTVHYQWLQPQSNEETLGELSDSKEWHVLGLSGWMGELTKPNVQLEQLHKPSNEFNYPEQAITSALLHGSFDSHINDIPTLVSSQRTEDVMSTRDVYIARANDPFGYSTKWELRNKTTSVAGESLESQRSKRGAIKLYSMIKCATGCEPLVYKGYGCFCGFLGTGRAMDDVDRCCKVHDTCYEQSNCISFLQYFVPYIWKCYRGKPLCAIDHGEWGGPQSCAAHLCNCDLRLARCLQHFRCPQRRAICSSSAARRFQNLIYFL